MKIWLPCTAGLCQCSIRASDGGKQENLENLPLVKMLRLCSTRPYDWSSSPLILVLLGFPGDVSCILTETIFFPTFKHWNIQLNFKPQNLPTFSKSVLSRNMWNESPLNTEIITFGTCGRWTDPIIFKSWWWWPQPVRNPVASASRSKVPHLLCSTACYKPTSTFMVKIAVFIVVIVVPN